jgi:hypothetical protein
MDRPIGFFWMGLMFLAIGLPATIGCLWLVNAERGRTMWPTVEGLVLSSKASPYVSGSSKGPNQLTYRPAVTYAYAIDGREYKSHRIGPSVWGTSSWTTIWSDTAFTSESRFTTIPAIRPRRASKWE